MAALLMCLLIIVNKCDINCYIAKKYALECTSNVSLYFFKYAMRCNVNLSVVVRLFSTLMTYYLGGNNNAICKNVITSRCTLCMYVFEGIICHSYLFHNVSTGYISGD